MSLSAVHAASSSARAEITQAIAHPHACHQVLRQPAYFPAAVQFGSAISTRRFFALPASVALSAIGLVLPKPLAVSRSAAIPCCASQVTIALARASESV